MVRGFLELSRTYKIAVLPGDGIGREVIPEAIRVLQTAIAKVGGVQIDLHEFEVGGQCYLESEREWSQEAEDFTKKEADAILLGAIGALEPDGKSVRLPDGNLAGYNVVIGLRMHLDLYANVRPVKLYEGVPTPLAEKSHNDIDMVIIRENTEGLYAPTRGTLSRGGMAEIAVDSRVITRKGSKRVSEYAFRLANNERNGAPVDNTKRVTCVDKSNLLAGCQLFRKVFDEVGTGFPNVEKDYAYVDAWTQWCLKKPEFYDVVVTTNAFGDIITDLGGAIQGGLGVAPAGNIGDNKAMFEPVHGSAPHHAGKNVVNPIAAILCSSMMFDWLASNHEDNQAFKVGNLIRNAVSSVLKKGTIRTYDLCRGSWKDIEPSSTSQVTDTIITTMENES
jgi:3-isopropylmalate dehydrogenase